jgi:ubiquinone/menaquinone biosynthesis C-methylase UbiE
MDPLEGSRWSAPGTVEGFSRSQPNLVLLKFVGQELERAPRACVLDLGCGAGRNAVPMAQAGCRVLGTDLSWPMLQAAAQKARAEGVEAATQWAQAPMQSLPARDRSFDVVVAHGIWNLARSGAQFRRAVAEAARVARPGASSSSPSSSSCWPRLDSPRAARSPSTTARSGASSTQAVP